MAENKVIICGANRVIGHGVDPLHGFFYEGLLADPVMQRIIPNMVELNEMLKAKYIDGIITADEHEPGDEELERLPPHCMKGTKEAEVIEQLKRFNLYIMKKKTTNSFVNTKLLEYLKWKKPEVMVVYGVCSNICVMQATITYSAVAEKLGIKKIILPMDCITTFGVDARIVDEHAFNILRYVPRVEVIPSYKNLGDVLVIN